MYRRYRKKRRFGGLPEATFSVFDKITGSYDFVLIIRRCDLFCVSVVNSICAFQKDACFLRIQVTEILSIHVNNFFTYKWAIFWIKGERYFWQMEIEREVSFGLRLWTRNVVVRSIHCMKFVVRMDHESTQQHPMISSILKDDTEQISEVHLNLWLCCLKNRTTSNH